MRAVSNPVSKPTINCFAIDHGLHVIFPEESTKHGISRHGMRRSETLAPAGPPHQSCLLGPIASAADANVAVPRQSVRTPGRRESKAAEALPNDNVPEISIQ